MTLFNVFDIFNGTTSLPTNLQFLGYIWIPATLIGYYFVYRYPPKTFNELIQKAVVIMLIFFLTRSWLAEQNMNVVIALAVLALPINKLNFRNFNFLWAIPLVFMFANTTFFLLFFMVYPQVALSLQQISQAVENWRLIARFILVVFLQIFAWRLVFKMFDFKKQFADSTISKEQNNL